MKPTNREFFLISVIVLITLMWFNFPLSPDYKQEYIDAVKENNDLKRELRKMNTERAKVMEIIKGDSLGTLIYW
jgi:hypothetical protein